jgi:cellulose synthase/poly-beta-1,6-N-acetylglucosamine synthase-like glycosyltransferase
MWQVASDGVTYLLSQSGESLLRLFWFVAIFEIPRYTLGFVSIAALSFHQGRKRPRASDVDRVSILIAGHNEADSIERCVQSLREQSRPPDQIIVVSDGSADRMPEMLRSMQQRGLIDEAHCTQVRSGKSAAVNLALGRATGEIVINVDCDCTFDRHALKWILEPFRDPQAGGVAGNIVVGNANHNVITAFQAIEYLISISQGKQAADFTHQMSCISGAFGAFRRAALKRVGGLDAGGGEDLDVTLRLRKAGWRTLFAAEAVCYTNVPETLSALVRQRFRWERDAVQLRYRKHGDLLNPFSAGFSVRDLMNEMDFMIFNVGSAVAFPIYLVWLFATYGDLALIILIGAQVGMLVLDASTFVLAALVSPRVKALGLAPYVIGYSLFNGFVMRFVRLAAYLQEWVFEASYRDICATKSARGAEITCNHSRNVCVLTIYQTNVESCGAELAARSIFCSSVSSPSLWRTTCSAISFCCGQTGWFCAIST